MDVHLHGHGEERFGVAQDGHAKLHLITGVKLSRAICRDAKLLIVDEGAVHRAVVADHDGLKKRSAEAFRCLLAFVR